MGMFDTLKISIDKLPLTDEEKSLVDESQNWQTKDFDCTLSMIYIEDNGDLEVTKDKYRWDDSIKGYLGYGASVLESREVVHLSDYHGYVNFYNHSKDQIFWFEFNAKYTDGKLVEIKRVPREPY